MDGGGTTNTKSNHLTTQQSYQQQLEPQQSEQQQKAHAVSIMGRRRHMEDTHDVIQQKEGGNKNEGRGGGAVLTAIFDGHGVPDVSRYLQQSLYEILLQQSEKQSSYSMSSSLSLSQVHSKWHWISWIMTSCPTANGRIRGPRLSLSSWLPLP
jgi:hypothetical protein